MNDGHLWTTSHQIMWRVLGALEHANYFWRGKLRVKKGQDKFKWPDTPWSKKDKDETHGKVAPEDREAAAKYLLSLSPKPFPKE